MTMLMHGLHSCATLLRIDRNRNGYGSGKLVPTMSTNTQFALGVHLLTLLASLAPESLSSELMAQSAVANPVQVRRVLGHFRRAGLVASKPGVGGGSHLLKDPATITLGDVWRIVQGENHVLGSYPGAHDCPVGQRIESWITDIDRRARHAIEDELQRTTISQLVDRAHAGPPTQAPPEAPAHEAT
jgi:Rrf2 family protein